MSGRIISMRKIKEVLRLHSSGLSIRQIATSLSLSKGTVGNYLRAAKMAELSWPAAAEIDEADLIARLFSKNRATPVRIEQFVPPDFSYLHTELKRKGVTLQLLWEEYVSADAARAYSYSRFCELYQQWRGKLKLSMRQEHRAGEKMFVDYAGQRVPIQDAISGEVKQAQIFVAVLGASRYAYCEASWSQTLPDWISAHVRAFNFFGGSTELVVPDNLRSGISEACFFEPDINPTYAEMARYYSTAIMPARPYKPKDKAAVENGVQIVERWILARLRNRQFFSLAELNAAISELMADYNNRPFKRLPGNRRGQYELLDRPALKPLPAQPFEYAEWRKMRVGLDYHAEVYGHYYSVPFQLVKKEVEARITAGLVEILYGGKRVASHARSPVRGGKTTLFEHMPKAHQAFLEWTPSKLLEWSAAIGPYTHQVVKEFFEEKPHLEIAYRACRGLVTLARRYGSERIEQACRRAIAIGAPTYKSINNILKAGLEQIPLEAEAEAEADQITHQHENVRGASYYRSLDMDTELTN